MKVLLEKKTLVLGAFERAQSLIKVPTESAARRPQRQPNGRRAADLVSDRCITPTRPLRAVDSVPTFTGAIIIS